MNSFDTHELAWAAGLFDGEGNIHFASYQSRRERPSKTRRLTLSIGQKDNRVLERFQRAVGFGRVYGPYLGTNGRCPMWHYQVSSFEKVQACVALLWTFLSPVKRAQAQRGLLMYGNYFRIALDDHRPTYGFITEGTKVVGIE